MTAKSGNAPTITYILITTKQLAVHITIPIMPAALILIGKSKGFFDISMKSAMQFRFKALVKRRFSPMPIHEKISKYFRLELGTARATTQ